MSDILDQIKSYKLDEIAALKSSRTYESLEREAKDQEPPRGFIKSLIKAKEHGFALITEIKKASPSKGLIRSEFEPAQLAMAYEKGGAACLSVLTDTPSFQGKPAYLSAARNACRLPVLRKDFLYDPIQVVEARSFGADAILIIMASVSDDQAHELEAAAAHDHGMDVLVEVHNLSELERALALQTPLIGVNNRDLRSFDVTLETTKHLSQFVPDDKILVSESGVTGFADLQMLSQYAVRCFLIGESLMRQADVEAATRDMLWGRESAKT